MTVEAIRQKAGASKARLVCDDCGGDDVVTCTYVKHSRNKPTSPNMSQARAKAVALGWAYVKGKLRCPACEEKRKVGPMKSQAEVAEVAEVATGPSKVQRIQIFALLADVYDLDAGRYKNGDTDDSVADVLGVRAGWVSEIRQAEFGPDGSNDDVAEVVAAFEASHAAFRDLLDRLEAAEKDVGQIKTEMRAEQNRTHSAAAKMTAIKAALSGRIKKKAGIP